MDITTRDREPDSSRRGSAAASTSDDVITVRGLRCSYGDYEAVRGIDLDVRRGELFALLGTNGAGKTTTMETLEGHRAPSAGTVEVLGLDPTRDRRALRPRIGMMLQESGFAGDLTVAETVRLWSKLTTDPVDADLALTRVALANRRDTRVSQLSGGQKRRLDLVLATLGQPEVLFLDEPTTGLDPESRERTWALVRQLLAGGTTIMMTTHYLEEAQQLADRVAIMHEGRIALAGTVAEVLAAQPSRVTFAVEGHAPGDVLRSLQTAVGQAEIDDDGRLVLETADLQTTLTRTMRWAEDHDHRLTGISATEASLATVFSHVAATEEDA